jgi:prepilin-type N-terminal cleavage/methylation domain-containing protein
MTAEGIQARRATTTDEGFSLLETVIALGILAIVAMGILPLGLLAVSTTENQGHLMARTTEYAQDKLEQLMALSFGDSTSDTRVFPAATTGGAGLTPGGSADTSAPANNYVDYLDINGNVLAAGGGGGAPANWFYMRAWRVEQVNAGNTTCPLAAGTFCLKRITVSATVRVTANGVVGLVPRSTVSALKTYPF